MSGLSTPSLRLSRRIVCVAPPKYANASSCSRHQISVDDFQTTLRNACRLLPNVITNSRGLRYLPVRGSRAERAFAVIDLRFLAGFGFEAAADLWLALAQLASEALHRVVGTGVTAMQDEVLEDRLGVAALLELAVDELAKRLGAAARRRRPGGHFRLGVRF